MPTNLYCPNDNYDLANCHVLSELLRKMYEAKEKTQKRLSFGEPMLRAANSSTGTTWRMHAFS